MSASFWDRIKKRLNSIGKPDIWLIKSANLGKTAIVNGQTKNTSPSIDVAYRCAKALRTSMEELTDGEDGERYLRGYVQEQGWGFAPPERIADIVGALQKLSDDELVPIRGAIEATLNKKEDSGTSPERKSDGKLPKTG
jgi:hypothetical protein